MEMVNNRNSLILLLSISSLLILSSCTPLHAVVKSLCDSTPNPPFCNSFIPQVVKHNGHTDPASILFACINRCIDETKLASNKAPMCHDSYVSAHDFLKEALAGFKTKALNEIQTKLTAARADSTTCMDDLESVGDADGSATQAAESLQNKILTCGDIAATAKIF